VSDAVQRWRVREVARALDDDESIVAERAAEKLGVSAEAVRGWSIFKRSIDARGRRAPRFTYIVDVDIDASALRGATPSGPHVEPSPGPVLRSRRGGGRTDARPVVIGMGPCGLFAAMQLAEAGLRPIVIDRGRPVETRARDVSALMSRGVIDPESNLCFGEGGAGTWSDGKLYTRVGGARVREVLERMVELGSPDRILIDGRPHLGTDRLVALLKAFRRALVELGCELRFETRVEDFVVDRGRILGVRLQGGETIEASDVILAAGHSARDMYRRLVASGVEVRSKEFAVGFRIEHPQALIDSLQYGAMADHPALPAAYYELKAQVGTRGVYSFCMCPGGSIVPTPTEEGEVCVNGMSHAARSGRWANSAMVVTVGRADFGGEASGTGDVLAGMQFQRAVEERAWELGGGAFVAPAQRAVDFLAGRGSAEVRRTSYKRGVVGADLSGLYPEPVTEALRAALRDFERRMPGYLSDDAVLVGVETRTSAPVTVVRDRETLMSPSVEGLYPAGEGSGHGGGIVSAAIDGLRVAHRVLDRLGFGEDSDRAGGG
jgi:uncharacterized FAD-dependent dehydrogenase